MKDFSFITNSHPEYIENLYRDFINDPSSVDPEMKKFFEGFDFAFSNASSKPLVNESSNGTTVIADKKAVSTDSFDWMREIRVYRLILGYRNKGHLIAKTNPIRPRKDRGANLDLGFFGLTEKDFDKTFEAGNLIGLGPTTLRNILGHLQACYASHVGLEFKYISDQKKIDWLTNEMERKVYKSITHRKKETHSSEIE
jgi:2-oxoglutarate dehydrogenase E1 component